MPCAAAFVTERDRVLVIGAGPIGLGAALFAKLSGARVSVMDIDSERLAAAKSLLGVGTILAGPEAANGVKAATNGEDFDIVFDATGNRNSMNAGFDFVAHGGRYVLRQRGARARSASRTPTSTARN